MDRSEHEPHRVWPEISEGKRLAFVVGLVTAVLALFVDKAFTIDDPLFLWLGKHILKQPADFFGFNVNWYGSLMPMHQVTMNPPTAGYLVAAAGALFGWGEPGIHAVFLLPAAAAVAGTFRLAQRFCSRPAEATLIGMLTPVFLVSSTNIMCDTLMLAFWCWALVGWIRGIDGRRWLPLIAGALGIGAAGLTKYFGFALLPLCLAYGLARERKLSTWALPLLIPLAMAVGYDFLTQHLYGTGAFRGAAQFATNFGDDTPPELLFGIVLGIFQALCFTGGSLVPALFFGPLLWSRRVLKLAGGFFLLCLVYAVFRIPIFRVYVLPLEDMSFGFSLQFLLLAFGGACLVAVAALELRRRRDADSWLLALWILGTFAFAASINWTNNGRSNLPMAPVLGILLVRRMDALVAAGQSAPGRYRAMAFVPAVVVALLVTFSDYSWANQVRRAASEITRDFVGADHTTYFQGHWGFQHYMEEGGAVAIQPGHHRLEPRDILVEPENNDGIYSRPAPEVAGFIEQRLFPEPRFARTMSKTMGAGFYASLVGPMPYLFGASEPDVYKLWRIQRRFRFEREGGSDDRRERFPSVWIQP